MREKDNVADTAAVGKEHNQTVDTDTQSSRRRQAVLQRGHKIFVHHMSFIITGRTFFHLFLETFALVNRIVELGEAIANLTGINKPFKTIGDLRISLTAFCQR